MSAPTLTRRQPPSATVAGKPQELLPNIVVLQFIKNNWKKEEFKPKFGGRDDWWDGSSGNQITVRPVTLGISKRNIMTLGANFHRRDPIHAIHIWARDPNAVDQMTEEVDRIVIERGVSPFQGVQYILPAATPATAQDESMEEGDTLYHNVLFVECLYYKNRG